MDIDKNIIYLFVSFIKHFKTILNCVIEGDCLIKPFCVKANLALNAALSEKSQPNYFFSENLNTMTAFKLLYYLFK